MASQQHSKGRHTLAVIAGPAAFAFILLAGQNLFGFKQAAALGTIVWMGLWWITTPVHISVTALLPIVVNAFFNLVPMGGVVSQYFSEIIVLLLGADLICLTWTVTGLDKRLSLKTLCLIGPSLKQQILVWLFASTILSIFLPNAVVCTIMLPVAVSMLKFVGEKDMQTSKLAVPILLAITWGAGIGGFGSPLGGAANLVGISYIEQLTGSLYVAQQATAGDRGERHRAKQLGVVGDAGPLAGIRPRPIEHVLAVRMKLAIQRQGCLQRALRVAQQEMGRLPAATPTHAAAVFQRAEEGVTKEGLIIAQQRIPFGGRQFGEAVQGLDRHARSLACPAGEKKPRQGGAQWSITDEVMF